ncbi:MAG: hypothetical protein ACE5JM_09245, partial [Armatimonadota bacterium]
AGFGLGEFSLGGTVALGVAAFVLSAVAAVLAGHRAPGRDHVDFIALVLLVAGTVLLWLARGLFAD